MSDMLHGFGMCTADYKVTQLSKKIHYLPKRLNLFALKPLQLCFCKDGHWILLLLWNIAKVGIFRVTDPWSWGWWHITVYHENGSVAQNMPTLLIKNQSDIKYKYLHFSEVVFKLLSNWGSNCSSHAS